MKRSGNARWQLLAVDERGDVITRVSGSMAKLNDPNTMLEAMARLQDKLDSIEP